VQHDDVHDVIYNEGIDFIKDYLVKALRKNFEGLFCFKNLNEQNENSIYKCFSSEQPVC